MSHRSILTRTAFSAAAACMMLAGAAAPAMAKEHANGTSTATTQAAGDSGERKICLSPTVTGEPVVTGSMLGKRQCKTRAEWEARGVKFQTK